MRLPDDDALLDLATTLAWEAAGIILALRARGVATESKPDASPVTEADRQAEAAIVHGLRLATPHIEVVAEEEISAGHRPARAEAYWMVDPLDGTRDFVALRDGFTVNIGLVRGGRPVLGVVAVPACTEMFGGIVGRGAWREGGAGRQPIHARRPPAGGLAVLSSRHRAEDPAVRAALAGERVASITQLGSAVKFCRMAEGAADAYVRAGRTMEWDTAGPQAVLEAAGGSLRLLDGGTLAYEKPDWANPALHLPGCPVTCVLQPDAAGLAQAAALLRAGGLVAFGTETVYGLGGDATQGRAVAAIFAAKGRPHFNPLICHYADADGAFAHVHAAPQARTACRRLLARTADHGAAAARGLSGGPAGRRRAGHAGGARAGPSRRTRPGPAGRRAGRRAVRQPLRRRQPHHLWPTCWPTWTAASPRCSHAALPPSGWKARYWT